MAQKRKTTKKSNNNNIISSKDGREDIRRLKKIAHKIVGQMEQAIDQCGVAEPANSTSQNKDTLFTGRNSLIAALITLTDLLLKLESTGESGDDISLEDELARLPLSKADLELLRHFVEKQHQAGEQ